MMLKIKKIHDLLFFLGRPFSPLYGLGMLLRSYMYRHDLFKRVKLPVPVISVGNLTMGGTGKTPMVIYLARLLSGKKKAVVISRGYGGKAKGEVNRVSDENGVYLSSCQAGDEPRLLADNLPGVPVLTGSKRVLTGRFAVESMEAELLIMDDGFQHMALCRDLDLVLFSASSLLGSGWVCPGGPLREFTSALSRADAFVITGVSQENRRQVDIFSEYLINNFPGIPVFKGNYRISGWQRADSLETGAGGQLKEAPLLAFCGIATPTSFQASLTEAKLSVKEYVFFKDHHQFSESDLRMLEKKAHQAGCQGLITTAKDFVKIKQYEMRIPIWVLSVELGMDNSFDKFICDRIL